MPDYKRFAVKLDLTAACPRCQQQRAVKGTGTCPTCGVSLVAEEVAAVRASVRSRRDAFKKRLKMLADRMRAKTDAPVEFVTSGIPQSKVDYLGGTMRAAIGTMRATHDAVARLLASEQWRPEDPACVKTFTELIRALDSEIDLTVQLSEKMPPLEMRAVHRELTRASVQFVRSHVILAQTICAVDADEAARLANDAMSARNRATRHLQRASGLWQLLERSPRSNPFRIDDGSLDIAAFVWSAVNLKTTSVRDAANLVRAAFADMPSVPDLGDHHATLLLPMLAVGAGVVDPELLTYRVRQLRDIIDGAGAPVSWVVQPALLVTSVFRGIERFAEETERLGLDTVKGMPRWYVMRMQTEVYRTLVEGTLRDLGGVILTAARASRGEDGGTYETDVIDGVKAGEIVNEMERMRPPCGGAMMIYRNASAHADVEVTDTGIVATARRIENGREVDRRQLARSDEEFAEDMVALQEILLALELAILPWLWSTSDPGIAAAIIKAPVTKRQPNQTVALLGGMAGLRDLSIRVNESRAIITCAAQKDDTDRRETRILSLVPAAFGLSPDIQQVSLHIDGLLPVMFDRTEFVEALSDEIPHKLPMLGFTTARWLLESGSAWTKRDEATYITFPLTTLHFACARLAGSVPPRTENVDQAVDSLQLSLSRLDQVIPSDRRSPLTQQAVAMVATLARTLRGLAKSRQGRGSLAEAEGLGQQAVATLQPMHEIQEAAKVMRDG